MAIIKCCCGWSLNHPLELIGNIFFVIALCSSFNTCLLILTTTYMKVYSTLNWFVVIQNKHKREQEGEREQYEEELHGVMHKSKGFVLVQIFLKYESNRELLRFHTKQD